MFSCVPAQAVVEGAWLEVEEGAWLEVEEVLVAMTRKGSRFTRAARVNVCMMMVEYSNI